ncbi:MAG: hypothetical protein AAGC92_07470 [Pseudomonadota bacterium]
MNAYIDTKEPSAEGLFDRVLNSIGVKLGLSATTTTAVVVHAAKRYTLMPIDIGAPADTTI